MSLPQSGEPKYFIRVGSGLNHKYKARLNKLAMDKTSGIFVNYGCKKFDNIGLRS
jgi:hypothetical protein